MSLVVMAHPARHARAEMLAASLGPLCDVVVDPGAEDGEQLPGIGGVVEASPLRCARWAWQRAALRGDWACVVQDDALPCRGFDSQTVDLVWHSFQEIHAAGVAVSFYYGAQSATGRRIAQAHAQDPARSPRGIVSRAPGDSYVSTVALVVPSSWITPWLAHSRRPEWADARSDDECWGSYVDANGLLAVATYPCLVDHDNTLPSVAGNDAHGPRSAAVPPPQAGVAAW